MSERDTPSPSPEPRKHKRRISTDDKLLLDRIKQATMSGGRSPSLSPGVAATNTVTPEQPTPAPLGAIPFGTGCRRFLKLSVRLLCWLYLLIAGGLIFGMHQWGQTNVTLAALMYAPPLIWVLPALALLLPVLVFDWKSGLCLLIATVSFFPWHLDFQIKPAPPMSKTKTLDMIRVLTWNRGQGKKASLSAIKKDIRPDFILLQDAKQSNYLNNPDYAEFQHIQAVSDFVILSRWPVIGITPLYSTGTGYAPPNQNPWGMRCVVIAAGQRCVIYNLHLPTPRGALESYMRGSFLWGVLGLIPGTPWQEKREQYESFWKPYLDFSQLLEQRLNAESGPVIVVGDFNTPPFGPIHRQLAGHLQDAHIAAGTGFGFTFPGDTHNPLALFQPWLRLDRIHASNHWQPLHCSVQEAPAQHLPVFAELRLLPAANAPLAP